MAAKWPWLEREDDWEISQGGLLGSNVAVALAAAGFSRLPVAGEADRFRETASSAQPDGGVPPAPTSF